MNYRNMLKNLLFASLAWAGTQVGLVAAPTLPGTGNAQPQVPTDQVVLLAEDSASDCEANGKWKILNDEGQKNFRRAVCLFHKALASNQNGDEEFNLLQKAVDQLRLSQNLYSTAKQQMVASFLEGQMHCKIGELYKNNTQSIIEKQRFCAARAAAWSTLNDLDWKLIDFSYDKDPNSLYPTHFDRLASCQGEAGILGPDFDAVCGKDSAKSDEDLQAMVENTIIPPLETKYFKGDSPLLAIFSRKEKQASSVKANAESQKEALKEDAAAVAESYAAFNDHYQSQIKPEVDRIVSDYQQSAQISRLILNSYNSWMKGLLYNGTKNLADDLVGPSGAGGIAEDQAKASELIKKGQLASADLVLKMIDQLKNKKAMAKVRGRTLCKAFYCSIAARDDAFTTRSSYDKACTNAPNPLVQTNPLCLGTPEVHKPLKITFENVAKQMTAREFCTQADVGFPLASARVNGMNGCPLLRD